MRKKKRESKSKKSSLESLIFQMLRRNIHDIVKAALDDVLKDFK